jgi:hypothetical protein
MKTILMLSFLRAVSDELSMASISMPCEGVNCSSATERPARSSTDFHRRIAGDHRIAALGVVDDHHRPAIEAGVAQVGLLLRPEIGRAPGALGRAGFEDGGQRRDVVLDHEAMLTPFLGIDRTRLGVRRCRWRPAPVHSRES